MPGEPSAEAPRPSPSRIPRPSRKRSSATRTATMFFRLATWEIALLLFAVLLGATALGVLVGRRVRHLSDDLKEPFGILQGALFGLVGPLLAFGLSLAGDRKSVV